VEIPRRTGKAASLQEKRFLVKIDLNMHEFRFLKLQKTASCHHLVMKTSNGFIILQAFDDWCQTNCFLLPIPASHISWNDKNESKENFFDIYGKYTSSHRFALWIIKNVAELNEPYRSF
jgi:hypothetical protein